MLKFYEFKTNGIKKKKRLKKLKKNDLAIDRKKKEIQKKMNVFVNGSSGLSKQFSSVFEKKQSNLEVKLTPEWIIDKFSLSRNADGEGNIIFYADENSLPWIELSLITLGLDYIKDEIVVDNDINEIVISFEFLLDAIKNECPLLYQEMYDLNAKEGIERVTKN